MLAAHCVEFFVRLVVVIGHLQFTAHVHMMLSAIVQHQVIVVALRIIIIINIFWLLVVVLEVVLVVLVVYLGGEGALVLQQFLYWHQVSTTISIVAI